MVRLGLPVMGWNGSKVVAENARHRATDPLIADQLRSFNARRIKSFGDTATTVLPLPPTQDSNDGARH